MGLTVTGEKVKVYRKDKVSSAGNPYTSYSISVSSKKQDGTWASAFIDVFFRKGTEVNNKSVINIKNSFYTVNEYQDKKTLRLMITDFDVIDAGEAPAPAPVVTGGEDWMNIPDAVSEELDNLFG